MPKDEAGEQACVGTHENRVEALPQALALQPAAPRGRNYRVTGEPGPACRTDRDLYLRLIAAGG